MPNPIQFYLSLRALLRQAQDRLRGEAISSSKRLLRRVLAMKDGGKAPTPDLLYLVEAAPTHVLRNAEGPPFDWAWVPDLLLDNGPLSPVGRRLGCGRLMVKIHPHPCPLPERERDK
ncbi:MAG: hypothetical protein AMJ88_02855 [Anaerolineae bacterium SM23_ 63]|nr:MAG: hypothetical protein AMJ88_02855 [Anaerolineae bacterium SM23_ 63]